LEWWWCQVSCPDNWGAWSNTEEITEIVYDTNLLRDIVTL